ncbi:hypothetical protein TSH100_17045 [Azospirillum sp. TSH100]|uniref:hypothetical protein n=1 Tax=Azospirillum sp. TSH100 TaxID=652764 RepID=UPI000D6121D6|nr:hypothetical protein [Azospirillum sp. TSH100]PWC84720.1 hypothetical protein TSH100_17045 [Azospirillum sp. TSH100]QCG90127.1 hypothetical protein E6C72_20465 [Azospirillum sp. TSH100]
MTDFTNVPVASVVALAGRRIDPTGAPQPRFPLEQAEEVGRRIAEAFRRVGAVALVSSAACGADLVALEQAERLGLRRRIVLPFAPDRFRNTSVIDRPGPWGTVFDRQVAAAMAADDLVVLRQGGGDDAYAAANEVILREAQALAAPVGGSQRRQFAMLVWEGSPRPGNDATAQFGTLARMAGFSLESIPTL